LHARGRSRRHKADLETVEEYSQLDCPYSGLHERQPQTCKADSETAKEQSRLDCPYSGLDKRRPQRLAQANSHHARSHIWSQVSLLQLSCLNVHTTMRRRPLHFSVSYLFLVTCCSKEVLLRLGESSRSGKTAVSTLGNLKQALRGRFAGTMALALGFNTSTST
jgi:hypothetical protein